MSLILPSLMPWGTETATGGASGNFTFSQVTTAAEETPTAVSYNRVLNVAHGAGDLLCCLVCDRGGGDPANHVVTDNSGGSSWTHVSALDYDNSVGGQESNTRASFSFHWRIFQAAGESDTTPAVTVNDTNSDAVAMFAFSIRPSATYGWVYKTGAVNGSGASDIDGINSGSISPTGDDIFQLGVCISRMGTALSSLALDELTGLGTSAIGLANEMGMCYGSVSTSAASGSISATVNAGGSGDDEGIVAIVAWGDN